MILLNRITWLSATITLIISLILITPLCGLLFQCGCDWPWLGLDAQCNYHKPYAVNKYPWCVSLITGVFSIGLAIVSGIYALMISTNKMLIQQPVNAILTRVLLGVAVFVFIAIITALPLMVKA